MQKRRELTADVTYKTGNVGNRTYLKRKKGASLVLHININFKIKLENS